MLIYYTLKIQWGLHLSIISSIFIIGINLVLPLNKNLFLVMVNTTSVIREYVVARLTVPPQRAHWWQMDDRHVQQKTLSFSVCISHLQIQPGGATIRLDVWSHIYKWFHI